MADRSPRAATPEPSRACIARPEHLHLASVPNVRDLGGLATADGRHIRPGVLFRAGTLRGLAVEDAVTFASRLGIRVFFDLRAEDEIGPEDGARLLAGVGIEWRRLAVVGEYTAFATLVSPDWEDYSKYYVTMASSAAATASTVLRAIVHDDALAVALSCTLGKDRTGVVAALLVSALGVTEQDCADDYAQTECCLRRFPGGFGWLALAKRISEQELSWRMATPSRTMQRFFRELRPQHASAAGLLEAHGITPDELARARELILT